MPVKASGQEGFQAGARSRIQALPGHDPSTYPNDDGRPASCHSNEALSRMLGDADSDWPPLLLELGAGPIDMVKRWPPRRSKEPRGNVGGEGTGGISAGSWIAGISEGSVTVGIADGNWTAGMSLDGWTAGTSDGRAGIP